MEQGSPGLHKPELHTPDAEMTGAEGRGDRSIRRRSRFTLARARAEPLELSTQSLSDIKPIGRGHLKSARFRPRVDVL